MCLLLLGGGLLLLPACQHTVSCGLPDEAVAEARREMPAPAAPPTPISPYGARPDTSTPGFPTGQSPAELPPLEDIPVPSAAENVRTVEKVAVAASPGAGAATIQAVAETRPKTAPLPQVELHPLTQAMQAFLDDRPGEALQHLRQFNKEDQELLLRLLPLVACVAQGGMLTDRLGTEEKLTTLAILRSLVAELQVAAPLVIDKLYFCQSVWAFGQAKPLGRNQFKPGDYVGLYAEIQNLTDRPVKGGYATQLASTLEIRDASYKLVNRLQVSSTPDRSRSPRTDHFTWIRFTMPPNLPPGMYTLRVHIRDLHTNRKGEKSLSFRVVSPGTAAAAH
jgi:hypothetical protein